MARAISSLPVPVSPKMRTVESVRATFDTCLSTIRSGSEEPAILAVFSEEALFVLKWNAFQEAFFPLFVNSVDILRMKCARAKSFRLDIREGQTRIVECQSIRIDNAAVGMHNDDHVWDGVRNPPKFLFVPPF